MEGNLFCVYVMSNKYRTVFYTGITNNLLRRVYEHRNALVEGFTKKYNAKELIYFEQFSDPENAILREKQFKDYRRSKKIDLVRQLNPAMEDLYPALSQ